MSSRPVAKQAQDWREILALYYPRVRGWFGHVLSDQAAVDDLTQEVFVRLCDRLTKGEVMLNPWSFIKVVAKNVFLEHLGERKRQKGFLSLNEEVTYGAMPRPEDVCFHEEAMEAVPRLLGRLPEVSRYILVGRYFLGLTAREMAEALGTVVSVITYRHNRAVCQLRELAVEQGITL